MPTTPTQPVFSVIVPTHGRPERLRACLDGLAAVDFPPESFEVIVSDDGSPMPLAPVVAPFHDRLRIQLITHPKTGPAAARNRGAACAQGRYLAFLDDDCVPAPDWLTVMANQLSRTPDHLIGGGIINTLPSNPFSTATHLIVAFIYDYHDRQPQEGRFFTSGNMVIPAAAFRAIGGFDESFPFAAGEDYDICHRWHHAGYGTTYAREAVVRHAHDLTLASFWRQHVNYGRGSFRCRLGIAQRMQRHWRGETYSFYLNLLRYPLGRGEGPLGGFHALLVAVSQVATAAGMAREALAAAGRACASRRAATRGSLA